MEIALPSVAVFISFIYSIVAMKRRKFPPTSSVDNEKRLDQVSVTITLFTALFLACNFPFILSYVLHIMLSSHFPSLRRISVSLTIKFRWFKYNSVLLFVVTPVFLNAALNPCLYLLRMPRYREQLSVWFTTVGRRLSEALRKLCV